MSKPRMYINTHPEGDRAVAILNRGFIDGLGNYCKKMDWLFFDGFSKPKQITINRVNGDELEQFIHFCQQRGADVYTRPRRGDEWTLADEVHIDPVGYCKDCRFCETERLPFINDNGIEDEMVMTKCTADFGFYWVDPDDGCEFWEKKE